MGTEITAPEDQVVRPPLLTVAQAALMLNTTESHVKRLIRDRAIPFYKVGRFVRLSVGGLEEYLESAHRPWFVFGTIRPTGSWGESC